MTLRTNAAKAYPVTASRSAQRWLVAILAVVALLVGACGDSSGDGDTERSSDEGGGFGIGDDDDGGDGSSDESGDQDGVDESGDGDGTDDHGGTDETPADDSQEDGADDAGDLADDGDDGTTRDGDPYLDLPIGTAETIEFDTNRSSAVRNGTLSSEVRDVYVVEVAKGQILTAVLETEGGTMALTGPFGERLWEDVKNLNQILPDDGDYTITLIGTEDEVDYTFAVGVRDQRNGEVDPTTTTSAPTTTTPAATTEAPTTPGEVEFPPLLIEDIASLNDVEIGINEEIKFGAGESSDSIENAVVLGQRNIHRFEAAAGQTLEIDVESLEANAVFTLIDPSGAVLGSQLTDVSQILAFSGDYWIIMGSTRGNATYTMFISIV